MKNKKGEPAFDSVNEVLAGASHGEKKKEETGTPVSEPQERPRPCEDRPKKAGRGRGIVVVACIGLGLLILCFLCVRGLKKTGKR